VSISMPYIPHAAQKGKKEPDNSTLQAPNLQPSLKDLLRSSRLRVGFSFREASGMSRRLRAHSQTISILRRQALFPIAKRCRLLHGTSKRSSHCAFCTASTSTNFSACADSRSTRLGAIRFQTNSFLGGSQAYIKVSALQAKMKASKSQATSWGPSRCNGRKFRFSCDIHSTNSPASRTSRLLMCSGWAEIRRRAIPYSSTPHLLSSTAASRIPSNPKPPANRRCVFLLNGTAAMFVVVVFCIRGTSSSALTLAGDSPRSNSRMELTRR